MARTPLAADHDARMKRAHVALEGLSIGDAFGERFFRLAILPRIAHRVLPDAPWAHTDDTAMACAIVEVLAHAEHIDQDRLAERFAERFTREPNRGYGGGAIRLLSALANGVPWRDASPALFDGGSFGNGGAMRAAPVGAYFADDVDRAAAEARASAEVTHWHPEGQAGAIAVAVAAAVAYSMREDLDAARGALIGAVLERTPAGQTRDGIERAAGIPLSAGVEVAARELGTGADVSAMDTVPFCIWCAARHVDDFEEAMWTTVSGLGDRDTTCAIVGGIVALCANKPIPAAWRRARERLSLAWDALP